MHKDLAIQNTRKIEDKKSLKLNIKKLKKSADIIQLGVFVVVVYTCIVYFNTTYNILVIFKQQNNIILFLS